MATETKSGRPKTSVESCMCLECGQTFMPNFRTCPAPLCPSCADKAPTCFGCGCLAGEGYSEGKLIPIGEKRQVCGSCYQEMQRKGFLRVQCAQKVGAHPGLFLLPDGGLIKLAYDEETEFSGSDKGLEEFLERREDELYS